MTITATIPNLQPSLALTEGVTYLGAYPSQDGGGSALGDYLGMIDTYAFGFTPGGVYAANGSILPIASNVALFSLVGTTYGGNGQTNFALPNLAGVATIGAGQGPGLPAETLGAPVGDSANTLTPAELPSQYGGSSQPFTNYQPSLPLTYGIAVYGVFPSPDGGGGPVTDAIGEVDAFAGTFVPGGFLPCDGRLLPISQYTALFSIIGTFYGGDGKTTFALPDLRGRTIVGASASDPVGTQVGSPAVTLTNADMPTPGTTAQPIDNTEPSLAMTYMISLYGIFPSAGGGAPNDSLPVVGQIEAFAGNFAPSGWAACDGRLLSIQDYSVLFDLIGTTFGGDGVTTFALPDLRGRTVIGTGGTFSVGELLGDSQTTLVAADVPEAAIASASATPSSGATLGAGATVTFTLTMNENVTVTGAAPTLSLSDGGVAVYSGPLGAPVKALTFTHVVSPGEQAADLTATALALPAGTSIANEAGTAADLSGFTAIDSGVRLDATLSVAFGTTVAVVAAGAGQYKITLSGTASDAFGVSGVAVYSGATSLGAATLSGGKWSFSATLGAGFYSALRAVATGPGGLTAAASAPFTLSIADNTVTETNGDGSSVVSTFNIPGAPWTLTVAALGASGQVASETFYDSHGGVVFVYPGAVTVSTFAAFQAELDTVPGGFVVADTAAAITAGLASLAADAGHIASIAITDSNPVAVGNGVFVADQAALDKIAGGFSVAGQATVLNGDLAGLEADQAHINSVTAKNPSGQVVGLTATVAQFSADRPILDKSIGGFQVADTAANITAGIASLAADAAHIASITITDANPVAVGNGVFAANQAALDKIAGGFSVAGQASVLNGDLDGLDADQAHINSVTAKNPSGQVVGLTASVAQFAAYRPILDKSVGGFQVADTAANVTAAIAPLAADAGHIAAITITDSNPVSVGAGLFTADQAALDKIGGGFWISGQASALNPLLAGLETDQAHINSVTAKNPSGQVVGLTAAVAQFTADRPILDKSVGGFQVADTAANVTAGIAALAADASHIASITITDSNPVSVGNGVFVADEAVLDKIVGGFSIAGQASVLNGNLAGLEADQAHINSVTARNASGQVVGLTATVAQFSADRPILDKSVGGFAVSDMAANVAAGLDLLQADVGHIASIALTDATEPTLTLTAAQKTADAAVLAKITSPYLLHVV